jgi:uncharacterized protein
LNIITDPGFYALAVPAVLITGLSKGGFSGIGTLSVPLLTLVVTAPQAVVIMLPLLLLADVIGLIGFRAKIDKAILKLAIPSGLVGILLGWLLFKYVNTNLLKAVIGIEAIIFAIQKLSEGRSAWTGPGLPLNKPKAAFFSILAGFASFLSHTGSPPMMQFMLPMKMDRMVMVGTLAWFFAFINFSKLIPYGQLGLIQVTEVATSLILLPCIPLGYWIGVHLVKKVSQAHFVRIIAILLLLTGIKLVWDAFA